MAHAQASAPGPIWQEMLKESGLTKVNSISGNCSINSFLNFSASSRFSVCAMAIVILPSATSSLNLVEISFFNAFIIVVFASASFLTFAYWSSLKP